MKINKIFILSLMCLSTLSMKTITGAAMGFDISYLVPEYEGDAIFHLDNSILAADENDEISYYIVITAGNYNSNNEDAEEKKYSINVNNFTKQEGILNLTKDTKDAKENSGILERKKDIKIKDYKKITVLMSI